MKQEKTYDTFQDFYPFYLSQHQNKICKRLHYIGSWLVLLCIFYAIFSNNLLFLFVAPIIGYAFAWVGHFFFEKNRPATFTYPVYSLIGDWRLFIDITRGKINF